MLTAEAVQKMIDDALGKATTAIVSELKTPKTDNGASAAAAATGHVPKGTRTADRLKRLAESDVHKGKGFDFARTAMAHMLAAVNGTDIFAAAAELDFSDDEKGALEAQRDIQKTMQASVFGAGGSLVPVQQAAGFIDLAVASASFFKIPGIQDVALVAEAMTVDEVTGQTTVGWIGENVAPALTEPTTGKRGLQLRELGATSILSLRLLRAAGNAEQLVRNRLLADYALKLSLTGFRSIGGQNTPKGLRYLMHTDNVFGQAGTTVAQVEADFYKLQGKVHDSYIKSDGCVYVVHQRVTRSLPQLETAGGIRPFKAGLEGESKKILDKQAVVVDELPINLGGGTDRTEIYYGRGSEIWHAHGDQMSMRASTEAAVKDGGTVRSIWSERSIALDIGGMHDFFLEHDKSWSCISDSAL